MGEHHQRDINNLHQPRQKKERKKHESRPTKERLNIKLCLWSVQRYQHLEQIVLVGARWRTWFKKWGRKKVTKECWVYSSLVSSKDKTIVFKSASYPFHWNVDTEP